MMLRGGDLIVPKWWIEQMFTPQIKISNTTQQNELLPKIAVGFAVNISQDGFVYKGGTNGQFLIFNPKKNLCISILASESEMYSVPEILKGTYL